MPAFQISPTLSRLKPKNFELSTKHFCLTNTAWQNDATNRSRTETSPSLNRPKKRCKLWVSISDYVNQESGTVRTWTCCAIPVPSSHNNRSPISTNLVLNCWEGLLYLVSVSMATVALVEQHFWHESSSGNLSRLETQGWGNLRNEGWQIIPQANKQCAIKSGSPSVICPTNHRWNRTSTKRDGKGRYRFL